jgi:hypothetical protein
MARRIDWDAVARQNRLKRWIRANSPFLDSVNDQPTVQDSNLDLEIERWAKQTVRRIAARVRTRHKNKVLHATTPLGEIQTIMDELGEAIENNDAELAGILASKILNLSIRLPLTELSAASKNEILKLVELTLQITEP